MTRRRSRSSGRPVSSRCSGAVSHGALPGAGTSCTWPSEMTNTAASRPAASSSAARSMASNRRVSPAAASPALIVRTSTPSSPASALRSSVSALAVDRLAIADLLARRLVDHHQGHVGTRLPLLADDPRVEQRGAQRQQRQSPQRPAAGAADDGDDQQQQRRDQQRRQQPRRQQRLQNDVGAHGPSRSRIVGRCTWSAL